VETFLNFLIKRLRNAIDQDRKDQSAPPGPASLGRAAAARWMWNDLERKGGNAMRDLFYLQVHEQLECRHCGYCFNDFISMSQLSLPVRDDKDKATRSLQDCVDAWSEARESRNMPCHRCDKRDFSRKCTISRFPRVLILSLDRFKEKAPLFSFMKVKTRKLDQEVRVPAKLDVSSIASCLVHQDGKAPVPKCKSAVYRHVAQINHVGGFHSAAFNATVAVKEDYGASVRYFECEGWRVRGLQSTKLEYSVFDRISGQVRAPQVPAAAPGATPCVIMYERVEE